MKAIAALVMGWALSVFMVGAGVLKLAAPEKGFVFSSAIGGASFGVLEVILGLAIFGKYRTTACLVALGIGATGAMIAILAPEVRCGCFGALDASRNTHLIAASVIAALASGTLWAEAKR